MLWTDPFEPLVTQLSRTQAFVPATDVMVSDGDLVLAMDVPGLTTDDLAIELSDDYLVIRGERKPSAMVQGVNLAHRERAAGRFERRLRIPTGVDPDAITASIDNGVLSLIVPKPERLKPKTIAISAGDGTRQLESA
jgi:HSP20 family protein